MRLLHNVRSGKWMPAQQPVKFDQTLELGFWAPGSEEGSQQPIRLEMEVTPCDFLDEPDKPPIARG